MSKVRFISDLHLGHKSIITFEGIYRNNPKTLEEHDQWIVDQWNSSVDKHDVVIVLGDICFDKTKLPLFKKMKGSKHLLLGNHDKWSLNTYMPYFDKIVGYTNFKGVAWLSHAPIHPGSLRGKFNIHGHTHHNSLPDLRYISVCVEKLEGRPVSWEDLLVVMEERRKMIDEERQKQHEQVGG